MSGAILALTVANERGCFGWKDAVVVAAVLAGIFLAGLYGDVVVGAVIFGIASFLEAVARPPLQVFRRFRPSTPRRPREFDGRRAANVAGRLP
jgi:hypothetical protein